MPEAHLTFLGLALALQHRRPLPLRFPGSRALGGLGLVGGAAIAAAATRAAGEVDLAHPDRLVTAGPYRWSRHPMYVAWTAAYVGAALVGATAWPLVLAPGLAAWVARDVVREERALARAFGPDHVRYRREVRHLL